VGVGVDSGVTDEVSGSSSSSQSSVATTAAAEADADAEGVHSGARLSFKFSVA
jgi:hypothetical protein